MVEVMCADKADPRKARQYAMLLGEGEKYPRLMARYKETVVEPRRETLREVIRRGVETGELRPDTDVEIAMLTLTGVIMAQEKSTGRSTAASPPAWSTVCCGSIRAALGADGGSRRANARPAACRGAAYGLAGAPRVPVARQPCGPTPRRPCRACSPTSTSSPTGWPPTPSCCSADARARLAGRDHRGSQCSRQRFVIGRRRSRPKFFWLIFGPGGYCRRLYSAVSTSRITRSTSAGSWPAAISSARPCPF